MISDHEMKRINLEFSANLARLIRMLHEDERIATAFCTCPTGIFPCPNCVSDRVPSSWICYSG